VNCATCKHWKDLGDDSSATQLGLKQCAKVAMFWDATEWNPDEDAIDYCERIFIQPLTTKAFVQDASDYRAYLFTMPDFGCNQHEV